jgi:hypothetical protein
MNNELESDRAMLVTFNAPVPIYPEGLAFVPPFLQVAFKFVCDQGLALTVRIRDSNRRLGGLQVSSGLRFPCCRRYRADASQLRLCAA